MSDSNTRRQDQRMSSTPSNTHFNTSSNTAESPTPSHRTPATSTYRPIAPAPPQSPTLFAPPAYVYPQREYSAPNALPPSTPPSQWYRSSPIGLPALPPQFEVPLHPIRRVASDSALRRPAEAYLESLTGEIPGLGSMPPPESLRRGSSVGGGKRRSSSSSTKSGKARQPPRSGMDKLEQTLNFIQSINYNIEDFLYYLFRLKDENGNTVRRSPSHAMVVSRYLKGDRTTHLPIEVFQYWLKDPAGRAQKGSAEYGLQYSMKVPYETIRHIREAGTSMIAQLSCAQMVQEQNKATLGSSGLHGTGDGRHGHKVIQWDDIGSFTIDTVQEIIQRHQPLTVAIIERLCSPRRKSKGVEVVRKRRPVQQVTTEVISTINFSHSSHARLLPAARGVLYFAAAVPHVVFNYESRVAQMPSWSTTYKLLKRMAHQDKGKLQELGQDFTEWLFLRTDNIQRQYKPWDQRVGKETIMKVGLAALAAEGCKFDPAAADLDDYLRRVKENKRADLTVDSLEALIDYEYLEHVATLHWVLTLVNYIPCLAVYKSDMARLFRTPTPHGAAVHPLPANHRTRLHSLSTVAKNETVTPELADAVFDFLGQIGLTAETWNEARRLVPIGGDGLTFESILKLRNFRHFEDVQDEFQSLDFLIPFLENFHTNWMYLSAIYETHWGSKLTKDISRLGHSATKINQKEPSNLKKVDYYAGKYVMDTVLDARMLDCWTNTFLSAAAADTTEARLMPLPESLLDYFARLAQQKQVPSLENLIDRAKILHRQFATRGASRQILTGKRTHDLTSIPVGTPLGQLQPDSELASADDFSGDQCLASSVMFMSDAIMSRELDHATSCGDGGRLYESLKVLVFSFAGSSHTRYPLYILEMISFLELECSPELRTVFLKNWLVNPSGKPGKFHTGDLAQEHLNLELETAAGRKDMEFDANYMRDVVSPNVYKFSELKREWGSGYGLAERRGKHTEPHSSPELRILLDTYSKTELHKYRAGRRYQATTESVKDLVATGILALEKGKLARWKEDSIRSRSIPDDINVVETAAGTSSTVPEAHTSDEEDENEALALHRDEGQSNESDSEVIIETTQSASEREEADLESDNESEGSEDDELIATYDSDAADAD